MRKRDRQEARLTPRGYEQQHRAGDHHRAADEHDGRPAHSALIITPLRTALRDERHLEFFRGREHAAKTAAGRGCCRFERHQGGLRISSADRIHGADNMDGMVNARLPRAFHQVSSTRYRSALPPAGAAVPRGLAPPVLQRQRQFLGGLDPVTAGALGLIERGIGRRQQHFEFGARRPAGDADADGGVDRTFLADDVRRPRTPRARARPRSRPPPASTAATPRTPRRRSVPTGR